MQRLLNVFSDYSLLMDLAISLTGLSFICALTYAMRWLPGRASAERNLPEDRTDAPMVSEPLGVKCPPTASPMFTPKTEKEGSAMLLVD